MTKLTKLATKVAKLDSKVHAKFNVLQIPHQNLSIAHPLRSEWQEANPKAKWTEKSKSEVAMRPSIKTLGRTEALSYDKLVRQTATRIENKDSTLTEVAKFVETDKSRLFQNLVWTLDFDNLTFEQTVPEPTGALLIGVGLAALLVGYRRR